MEKEKNNQKSEWKPRQPVVVDWKVSKKRVRRKLSQIRNIEDAEELDGSYEC